MNYAAEETDHVQQVRAEVDSHVVLGHRMLEKLPLLS